MSFPGGELITILRKKNIALPPRINLPVASSDPTLGLSAAQVEERARAGLLNTPVEPPSKSVAQIIASNLLTYFNIIFFILAACVIVVGAFNQLTFMPVILANILIGIVQELRSKKTLDKLSLLNSPKGVVIREGRRQTLNISDTARDDVVAFAAGSQIFADAVVLSGECQVNEALITGEADEIKKGPGDALLSGSFVVSGDCHARLTAVGADSFVSKLTLEAKKSGGRKRSEMMNSLSRLVKWIGILLIPMGVALCFKEVGLLGRPLFGNGGGVAYTVGALVGMIPEGLYLLTSVALTAGVLRLAQKKTLVHELGCIETLARVDTLCVDKTGTITENKMVVEDVILLCEDRFIEDDIRLIMADYIYAIQDDNDTMAALHKYFTGTAQQQAIKTLPFSSVRKYGGVSFHEDETYLLGAPDILLGQNYDAHRALVEKYAARGCRVLLLALYDGALEDPTLNGNLMPLSLILLANKIRATALETFAFFAAQGVQVKVISGDNALTVSEVARRAGIENAERFVDARSLTTDVQLKEAAVTYTIFGRVTPEQKRKLVRAMKEAGRTVAMTGDGVNDVLALKEADCSVAMASGSDVACQVSDIVLLNSDFSSMPNVVMEGRRVINNIERAASLFLVKNIFSFLMAIVSLAALQPYPVNASQLSLVSTLTIGVPSFILALEPNNAIVKGKFLSNVLYRALPGGLTNLFLAVGVLLFYLAFSDGVSVNEMSTICAIILGVVGLLVLYQVCKPFNRIRKIMMAGLALAMAFCVLFLKALFTLTKLNFSSMLVLAVFALLAYPVMFVIRAGLDRLRSWWNGLGVKRKAG
ncbi:MAG: HAD-IC family P-type ATPase [Firmicutes bacterium]|nr:HAD-IC family P-type ATPase [Bacillota bacterium]